MLQASRAVKIATSATVLESALAGEAASRHKRGVILRNDQTMPPGRAAASQDRRGFAHRRDLSREQRPGLGVVFGPVPGRVRPDRDCPGSAFGHLQRYGHRGAHTVGRRPVAGELPRGVGVHEHGLTGPVKTVVSVNQECPATPFLSTYAGVPVTCAKYGEDYARKIKLYFEQLADTSKK